MDAPGGQAGTPTSSPAVSTSASAPGHWTEVYEGEFVSQASPTRGRAVLTVAPSKVELKLSDFSTGDGGNLYVHLNPGKLGPNAAGEVGLSSTQTFVLAPLKARRGAQSYDLTPMWKHLPEVQSVTIYQYSSRVRRAYGTANLVSRY
ncbi:DM13 domain-containing protein [Arthrobacter sp. NPDC056727]|uniref:DM13 domain-containing protein n=1 Tax=Arthrobacter sp. NPDC056727 TaxID=3345927 RepID=UPI00366BAE87